MNQLSVSKCSSCGRVLAGSESRCTACRGRQVRSGARPARRGGTIRLDQRRRVGWHTEPVLQLALLVAASFFLVSVLIAAAAWLLTE